MKNKIVVVLIFICTIFYAVNAFPQFADPSQTEWDALVKSIRGVNGVTLFGECVLIVQLLFFLLRTAIGEVLGFHRLLILSALSVIVTIGAKLVSGEHLLTAITDGSTLVAYQVLIHQYIVQYGKRFEDRAKNSSDSNSGCHIDSHNDAL